MGCLQMIKITESSIENYTLELLQKQGYDFIIPEQWEKERENLNNVILNSKLYNTLVKLNPHIPEDVIEYAYKQLININNIDLIETNAEFQNYLTDGIPVEYSTKDGVRGDKVKVIDFDNIENNEFNVCNQFTVTPTDSNELLGSKRPDVVLFVNGLPIVVIELKNPTDESATVKKAYTQLQNYKNAIPQLFCYNGLLIASDGLDAKAGSLTAGYSRFMTWKTSDGISEDKITTPQIETMILGMLKPEILLDVIKNFTVFENDKTIDMKTKQTIIRKVKKIAGYHQYYAVKKAIKSTQKAISEKGDRKVGIIWHTQGAGKSLSMVFYTGQLILNFDNPTVVVITDRNDLDDQLFDTFSGCSQLLRQTPIQAKNRSNIKELLKTSGGGIIFSTIQKFLPESGGNEYEKLSDRRNIIVIVDEAHRSQYGFRAKISEKEGKILHTYGFAKYLRDAIPNASFIGFTATPIEKEDVSTRGVFGDEIDIYDIRKSQRDGSTVPIYYESRLVKIHLKDEEKTLLDEEVSTLTDNNESFASEKAKAKWTQLEAIIGHPARLKDVAKDITSHYEARQEALEGKAMIVTMSRRIAVNLYEQIIKLYPEWHNEDKYMGKIKVVMTSTSSDPESWQIHNTSKTDRRMIADRLKNPTDELEMAIVVDMWLTGFDIPVLNTMYVDKPMRGHNLMQAIARVNRVYKDKPGGLIVDYIGIASDLKIALQIYSQSGGKGEPTIDIEEAVAILIEKYEIVEQMFCDFDYKKYFKVNVNKKMGIILEAQEYVLKLPDGKDRYIKNVVALSKIHALTLHHKEARRIRDNVAFFQAIKARLVKFEPRDGSKSDAEIETAIKQIIDKAIVSDGVIDIFDAAGIEKPDISVLSDKFLEEVKGMRRKNLALELLKKIILDQIKIRANQNHILSRKLSKMLEEAINRYKNNLLTTAQILEELIEMAKEIRKSDERGENLGLIDEELAFYDALADNSSAIDLLGNDMLKELAIILVNRVRKNATLDWTIKETARAKMRVTVKRLLREFGYPPDKELLATENVLKQAELYAELWLKQKKEGKTTEQMELINREDIEEINLYDNFLPVYSLKAAAGKFGQVEDVEELGWIEVKDMNLSKDMFVAQIQGNSMRKIIKNGEYGIFKKIDNSSGQGEIVLIQHRDISDSETGGSYSIKRYYKHKDKLEFKADTDNPHIAKATSFELKEPIDPESIQIIAEFVGKYT